MLNNLTAEPMYFFAAGYLLGSFLTMLLMVFGMKEGL